MPSPRWSDEKTDGRVYWALPAVSFFLFRSRKRGILRVWLFQNLLRFEDSIPPFFFPAHLVIGYVPAPLSFDLKGEI